MPKYAEITQMRSIKSTKTGDPDLGPLQLLPGVWKNVRELPGRPGLPGRGWNMIALPFQGGPFKYRLLVNQYNEKLKFSLVDKDIPNRGIEVNGVLPEKSKPERSPAEKSDQFVVAIDYEQTIKQIAAADFPVSGLAGPEHLPIHHEPGLLLYMTNKSTDDLDIARLATIPHGDSVLALGRYETCDGPPTIPDIGGLPVGVDQDLDNPYLAPYKHFDQNLFQNLFNPVSPNDLLKQANGSVKIKRTTQLEFDTDLGTGGIVNIPFIVAQANATQMKATFWIQELEDAEGNSDLRLQYTQTVFLDFFPRKDGKPGLIRWPHVSINTLVKV